jgi:hypothetical protein
MRLLAASRARAGSVSPANDREAKGFISLAVDAGGAAEQQ